MSTSLLSDDVIHDYQHKIRTMVPSQVPLQSGRALVRPCTLLATAA